MTAARLLPRAAALALAASLAACSSMDIKQNTFDAVETMHKGPEVRPLRTITGFSDALRCMDTQFISYGIRDLPILVEDLNDNTKKVNAGTRDMLISAVSEMSKRSRAVRLITFGPDVANLANFHGNAESKRPYQDMPVFDIRGSISQLDEDVYKKQYEAGVTFSSVGVGVAKTGGASILALDLSVINGQDYSVIPGVVARNSALIYKSGAGADGEAEYKKLGINFGLTVSRSEGRAQALRTLVELAAIELMGKLTKTPYWNCLGAAPSSPEVKTEIHDWFYAMSANDELVEFFQRQLRLRGAWAGEIDGEESDEFLKALAAFRGSLGLSAEPLIDEALLATYFATPHRRVVPLNPLRLTKTSAAARPASAPADASSALAVRVSAPRNAFRAGEQIDITVAPSRDAHLYCYLQDEDRKIRRFFPNRFASDPLVRATAPVRFPGDTPVQIVMNAKNAPETIACWATPADVTTRLPRQAFGTEFEALGLQSLEQLRAAFAQASGHQAVEGRFDVQPR